MKRRVTWVLLGVGTLLGLNALSGCNAVLGIDEARLDGSSGSTGKAGSTGSGGSVNQQPQLPTGSNACTAQNSVCATCLANTSDCQQKTNVCLGDPDCRKSFDRYRYCLTKDCDAKDCIERLYDESSAPDCIIKNCQKECAPVPIESACQLYCACMAANCQNRFQDGTFSTMDACIKACDALPPDVQTCRRTHCEIAGDFPTEQHCYHATGSMFCAATGNTRPATCTDKSLNSFACKADSECCSGFCNQDTRACATPQ